MKCYQPMNITTTLTAKGNSYLKLNLNCIKGQLEREWHCSTLVPLQHLRETGETHPRRGFITWGAEHRLHFTPVHPLSKTLRKQWPENNIAFQCLLVIPVKCIHSEQNILSYGYCKHLKELYVKQLPLRIQMVRNRENICWDGNDVKHLH